MMRAISEIRSGLPVRRFVPDPMLSLGTTLLTAGIPFLAWDRACWSLYGLGDIDIVARRIPALDDQTYHTPRVWPLRLDTREAQRAMHVLACSDSWAAPDAQRYLGIGGPHWYANGGGAVQGPSEIGAYWVRLCWPGPGSDWAGAPADSFETLWVRSLTYTVNGLAIPILSPRDTWRSIEGWLDWAPRPVPAIAEDEVDVVIYDAGEPSRRQLIERGAARGDSDCRVLQSMIRDARRHLRELQTHATTPVDGRLRYRLEDVEAALQASLKSRAAEPSQLV